MAAPPPPPPPPPNPSSYNYENPPLPPPKPGSENVSRTGTPLSFQQQPYQPVGQSPLRSGEDYVPDILLDLSRDDLLHLLSNSELLDALFTANHPSSQSTTNAITHALQSNASQAQHLDTISHNLEAARNNTSSALLQTRALERAWREKEKEMYIALGRFSAPALHSRLGQAVGEAEAVSKALEESFLEDDGLDSINNGKIEDTVVGKGGRDVENFVKSYRGVRALYHLRKERRERWDENRVGGWR